MSVADEAPLTIRPTPDGFIASGKQVARIIVATISTLKHVDILG
jgi:hypothetical protein